MARPIHKLSVRQIETLSRTGLHGDEGGLYLRVREDGSKRWIFVWTRARRRREMTLGEPKDFTLHQARDMAEVARQLLKQGLDPLEMRRAAARTDPGKALALEQTKALTFGKCAQDYIAIQEDGWKNAKHRWQWQNSITNH